MLIGVLAARWEFFRIVLKSRVDTSGNGTSTHFAVYDFIPDVLAAHPLFGLGLNNFSVYYEFVTGRTNFGPHSFYVATIVETGLVGTLLFGWFLWYLFRRLGRLREIGRTLASPRIRPLAWGLTAALVGTIAANAFYLTMSFYYFYAFATLVLAAPIVFARKAPLRVVILTASYPRHADDIAGHFVRDAVEHARAAGVEIEVVSPADFRHFGIAYGHGVIGNLRRRPWLVLALPLFLAGFVRAARRASRDADLVHAHWLPAGFVAALTGKPFLVQLWGTGVELARRVPWLARPILRRARAVVCASNSLADSARDLGARRVEVIPNGVELPTEIGEPDEPPHVLFAGRLSPEKGIAEFLAATTDLARVIVGAGAVSVPESVGFVPITELGDYYRRAAVVCVPSRREDTASSHARRWPMGARSSLRRSAGSRTRFGTGRPDCSCRPAIRRRCGRRSSDCSKTRSCAQPSAPPPVPRSQPSSRGPPRPTPSSRSTSTMSTDEKARADHGGGRSGRLLLTELLLEQGYEVFGVVRSAISEHYENLDAVRDRVELIQADLLDEPSLVRALEAARPDEVYNLAAPSFVPMSWEQPVLTAEFAAVGATALLEAVRIAAPAARLPGGVE